MISKNAQYHLSKKYWGKERVSEWKFRKVPARKELQEHRFGALVADSLVWSKDSHRITGVLFRCDCGKVVYRTIMMIRNRNIGYGCQKCAHKLWVNTIRTRKKYKPRKRSATKRQIIAYHMRRDKALFRTWKSLHFRNRLSDRWRRWFYFCTELPQRPFKHAALNKLNSSKKFSRYNTYWGFLGQDRAFNLYRWGDKYVHNGWIELAFGIDGKFCEVHFRHLHKRAENGFPLLSEVAERWFSGSHKKREDAMTNNRVKWYDIPNTNKLYQVSNTGLVKSGTKILNPEPDGNGKRVYELNFEIDGRKKYTVNELQLMSIPNTVEELRSVEVVHTPPQIYPAAGIIDKNDIQTGVTVTAAAILPKTLGTIDNDDGAQAEKISESLNFLFPESSVHEPVQINGNVFDFMDETPTDVSTDTVSDSVPPVSVETDLENV